MKESGPSRRVVTQGDGTSADEGTSQKRRPDLLALIEGAIDARLNHLDYFDTVGGDELRRMFRHYRATRRGARKPVVATRQGRDQKAA